MRCHQFLFPCPPFTWVCITSYDVFAINLASVMLGYVYGHTTGTAPHHPGKPDVLVGLMDNQLTGSSGRFPQLSTNQEFGIKVAAPIGNLLGQLLFGWLADIVGRKRMCMIWFIFCPAWF